MLITNYLFNVIKSLDPAICVRYHVFNYKLIRAFALCDMIWNWQIFVILKNAHFVKSQKISMIFKIFHFLKLVFGIFVNSFKNFFLKTFFFKNFNSENLPWMILVYVQFRSIETQGHQWSPLVGRNLLQLIAIDYCLWTMSKFFWYLYNFLW